MLRSDNGPIFFGNPESPEGALCPITNRDDIIRFNKWLFETWLRREGVEITPEVRAAIDEEAITRQLEFERHFVAQGVPNKFVQLFALTHKRDVERYCRDLELPLEEFGYLIGNCAQIGYTHSAKHREFVPPHLALTKGELGVLRRMQPGPPHPSVVRIFRKINQAFVERKHISAHLLEQGNRWHCLYLTFRDCQPGIQSHWVLGPHIHYVSYLWPNVRKRNLWDNFERRRSEIRAGVHIRFVPQPQEAT